MQRKEQKIVIIEYGKEVVSFTGIFNDDLKFDGKGTIYDHKTKEKYDCVFKDDKVISKTGNINGYLAEYSGNFDEHGMLYGQGKIIFYKQDGLEVARLEGHFKDDMLNGKGKDSHRILFVSQGHTQRVYPEYILVQECTHVRSESPHTVQ